MISVIMATYNGAPTLARTLDAMTHLTPPDAGYEIIVIDNASTDCTATIIDSFLDRLPLTHLHEARRGKAHALNTGIEAAQGDFLVFTDDDVIPDAGWLRAYEAAALAQPNYGFFIGQVRHDWAKNPPHWLERLGATGKAYGGTPVDLAAGPVQRFEAKGANMAVRRATLGDVRNRTDTTTNYTGVGTGTGGVDSWFAHDASGGRIWYVPEACLKHMVRLHEISLKPIFKRYVRIGTTSYHINPVAQAHFDRLVLGIPVKALKRLLVAASGVPYRLLRGDTETAANRIISVAIEWGRLKGWYGKKTQTQESRRRIFVTGVPRSGTTLVQGMLNARSDMVSFPESHIFSFITYDLRWRMYGNLAPYKPPLFMAQLRRLRGQIATLRDRPHPWLRYRIELFLKRANLEDESYRFDNLPDKITPLTRAFIKLLDDVAGTRHWVEKTPKHVLFTRLIESHVPDARFIHVIRKGEDALGSIMDAAQKYPAWAERHIDGKNTVPRMIALWNNSVQAALANRGRTNHLIVSYEDVITNPEKQARRMSDFLGLPYDSAMIRPDTQSTIDSSEEHWKADMGNAIKSPESKFEKVFTAQERALIRQGLISLPADLFDNPKS